MSLTIHTLRARQDNFVYVLSSTTAQCAVIDPGQADVVLKYLHDHALTLSHILCTHHHPDHVFAVPELKLRYPQVEVWTSTIDLTRIAGATLGLRAGDWELLGEPFKVLDLPGHTRGQIGFWFPRLDALFSGDTLFTCGCGRLFEGSPAEMFATLSKIKALPSSTQIYFGHEYSLRNIEFVLAQGPGSDILLRYKAECEHKVKSGFDTTPGRLAIELQINPFLKAGSLDEFRQWRERRDSW